MSYSSAKAQMITMKKSFGGGVLKVSDCGMDSLDSDSLLSILETAADVILHYVDKKALLDKLLDFDAHQREKISHDILYCLQRGMSLSLEIDAFNELVEQTFVQQSPITKGLRAYWKKNFANLQTQYKQRCPLSSNYVDFKWVSSLPSESKFGLSSAQPTVRCQFQTTNGPFSLDLSPEAVHNLAREVAAIQTAIQEIK